MTTTKRIRNVAFLGLLVTLVWAGPITLRADDEMIYSSSGGFFCGYGDCTILWTNCPGTWFWYSYPDESAPPNPGDCTVKYEPSGGGCDYEDPAYVETTVEGNLYEWTDPIEDGGAVRWACRQT